MKLKKPKERTILWRVSRFGIVYEDGQWAAELLAHAVEEGDDHGDEEEMTTGMKNDHGDDHGAFEWAGVFSVADSRTWSMQKARWGMLTRQCALFLYLLTLRLLRPWSHWKKGRGSYYGRCVSDN